MGLVSNAPVTVGAGPSPMLNVGDGVAEVDAPADAEVAVEPEAEVEGLALPPLEDPPHAVEDQGSGDQPEEQGTSEGRREVAHGNPSVVAIGRDHPRRMECINGNRSETHRSPHRMNLRNP